MQDRFESVDHTKTKKRFTTEVIVPRLYSVLRSISLPPFPEDYPLVGREIILPSDVCVCVCVCVSPHRE
jgi:hypothetical protein